jgi:stress-induced-phosphoprotein 1
MQQEENERRKREEKQREESKRRREEEDEKKKREEKESVMTDEEKEELERKKQAESEKQKGNEFYKKKEFEQALQHYNKALELDPNNVTVYNNIAAVLYEQGQYDKVIETLNKAIDISRDHAVDFKAKARAYERLGNAYVKLNDYDKAIEAYERSLLEENNDKVRTTLKRIQEAKTKRETEQYINPDLSEKHKEKGNEYYKEQKWNEAIQEYTEALKRNPENIKALSNRANAYAKLMDFGRALEDAEKAIKIDPKFVKPYIRKGLVQHFLKQYHKALQTWEQAAELDPNNPEILEGRRKTFMAINSGESDPEAAARAMQDPEIQRIMRDPTMNKVLMELQQVSQLGCFDENIEESISRNDKLS